jgi:hypothetical protein
MKCPHCSHEKDKSDYQVPQTTVYPDINKCYPNQNGYTTNVQYITTAHPYPQVQLASLCSTTLATFIRI